jgi:hypothetical protein
MTDIAPQNKEATRCELAPNECIIVNSICWAHKTLPRWNKGTSRLFQPQDIQAYGYTDQYHNRHTNTTATTFGGQIHLTRYSKPLRINAHPKRASFKKATITTRRANNINRAKRQVYRLVMANYKRQPIRYYQNPVWATLTYPASFYANVYNRNSHIKDLEAYFRQLRKKYGAGIRYLAVMELTKQQNVHWHVLVFNMPKYESIKDLAQIWIDYNAGQGRECSHGGQELERLPWGYKNARNTSKDIAGYLSKYLAKTFDALDFSNKKMYLPSKGLEQPVTISNIEEIQKVLVQAVEDNYFMTFQSQEYDVPHVGTVYIQVLEPQT